MTTCDVAVVGAGPYGLSIAAHLRARNIDHRIFGVPLSTWRTAMPKGMLLKSDGFASDISSPLPGSRLGDYCRERGLPYHDNDVQVRLETFVDYGLDFQQRFVPELEQVQVTEVAAEGEGFRLTLETGESLHAHRVVMAVGITHFARMPDHFRDVSPARVTHSSAHHTFDELAGRDVTVIGAGSSAVDVAIDAAKAGARSRLVSRGGFVKFSSGVHNDITDTEGLVNRIRRPSSGLGPGWRSRICCDVPDGFRLLPASFRATVVRRHLGPSTPFYLREAFESTVESWTSTRIGSVKEEEGGPIRIELIGAEADIPTVVETDHVICATGYRADLGRLTMIEPSLRARIETGNDAPALDTGFQSSVKGMYFVGNAAAMSFGPLMRFMYGDAFAARRVVSRLAKAA